MDWEVEKARLAKQVSEDLYQTKAIKFGRFELTSGQISSYYIDLRLIPSHPAAFDRITSAMGKTLEEEIETDKIVPVPTAALSFGGAITKEQRIPMPYVRKKPRDHGRERTIEGKLEKGDLVTIVDDVTTTGGSLIEAAGKVRKAGVKVRDALVLVNREQGAIDNLKKAEIDLHYVTTTSEVVEYLRKEGKIKEKDYNSVIRCIEDQ